MFDDVKIKSFLRNNIVHIVLILLSFNLNAQNWSIGAEYGKGAILAHRKKMKHLITNQPSKFEITFQKQTLGNKEWHKTYNLPKISYSVLIVDYGEVKLGKTIASNIQFYYPIYKKGKNKINTIIGLGAGYNTNPFDRKLNYQNNVFGSKFTGCLHLKINYEYSLSEKVSLFSGVGLIHFSNGAAKLPNLGINVIYFNTGLIYNLSKIKVENSKIDFANVDLKKINFSVDFSNGWKDVVYSGGKRYLFNVLSLKTHYNTSRINRFTGGFEFFYDRSVNEFRSNFGLVNDKNRNHKSSIVIGHELKIGKVYAVLNYGIYLHQAYNNVYAKSYQRYQIKYNFSKNYYLAAGLKVHKGVADVIECTIGLEI